MIKKHQNGIIEIELKAGIEVENPFWEIEIEAVFRHEKGTTEQKLFGFYDGRDAQGNHIWKVRWMPTLSGDWTCRVVSSPVVEDLTAELELRIKEDEIYRKGFLNTIPGEKWGFRFGNGQPFYLFGDTIYNIFGAHYCGVDVEKILRHRKTQGVNYVRARMQVSPYHPQTRNSWQTKDCWPWGGSSQLPDFTRLNLEYFHAVDEVVSKMTELEMGLEVIFEAWLWEFPFNDRNKFTPEVEELWFRYITSRYAAYPAVYIWCPANEYEFYPAGEVKYHKDADRWLKRLAGIIRECDPYRHPIGAHNWEQKVPLCERVGNIEDIDVYLIQTNWGMERSKYNRDASLCMYLESQIRHHAPYRDKVTVCAEFGYEKVKGLFTAGAHQYMDHHHTRRGQWRAGFSGYPVVHGFDNTWGAHMTVEQDAVGAQYLIHFYRFMTEDIVFFEMSTAPELFRTADGSEEEGTRLLCLANKERSVISVYFPAGGSCTLDISSPESYKVYWINPRTGKKTEADCNDCACFTAPQTEEGGEPWGDDWVLLLKKASPKVKFPRIQDVEVKDDFLGQRIKINQDVTIQHIIDKCYEMGIVENFARAAGIRKGDYSGLHNSDEFLYKTIEAASYSLQYEYDSRLDQQLDEIISLIAAAQESDGYLRTPHTIYWLRGGKSVKQPRWSRLDGDLELYSLGHMIEGAVAHYRATCKTSLLNVAIKSADLIDRLFGIGKAIRGVDMIPEIELSLVKLYEVTGERRYIELARYFIEERGDASGHKLQGETALDHVPLREQPEAVGHATYAAYLYSGAADLVYYETDPDFIHAIKRLWNDAVFKKMSINGGFGARHDIEGFSVAYDIPDLTAYNEICAAVGWCLLNQRMFKLDHDGKYFDVFERTLYNNVLNGVSLDGKAFFYVCPTESDGKYKFNLGWCPEDYEGPYKEASATHKEWLPCACCPPTLARFLPQIPSLAYAVDEKNVFINLYLSNYAKMQICGQYLTVTQKTNYPWEDKISIKIHAKDSIAFRLHLRIPGWLSVEPIHGDLYSFADNLTEKQIIRYNGQIVEAEFSKGYAIIDNEWNDNDEIELVLPLRVRRVVSHPFAKQNTGKVALQRGPVLFCAEGIDNEGKVLNISIPDTAKLDFEYNPLLLRGIYSITGDVVKTDVNMKKQLHKLVSIPYYAWSNRGENEMAVWFGRE